MVENPSNLPHLEKISSRALTLPRPDYFDGGAKSIVHCLNFDRCFARGKIQSQFFVLPKAKYKGKL